MPPPPLVALRDVRLTFGGRPLFTGVTMTAGRGEKICLVGRNGSGKSTLLRVLAGEVDMDAGERFVQPGIRIGYLPQDPALDGGTVAACVAAGLPAGEEEQRHRVYAILGDLRLDGGAQVSRLSGGERRRTALARLLVGEPDVLLLDEPTNHLDLPTILWLEQRLAAHSGAIVVISHDRAFLKRVSTQTLWLDRGTVRRNEKGFEDFARWSEEVLAAEEAELARMDKKLAAETHWLHRGVTARRRRNMGRLRKLMELRRERKERLSAPGVAKLAAEAGQSSGRLVIEAENVTKRYGDRTVVGNFSTRILRGDRIGIIGPNGAGKTTLLRLLTGELPPDAGTVRLGTNLQPAYFDQHRQALDPEATVREALTGSPSGDTVRVHGKPRHVMGYLKDFLFEERQAMTPVKALSGGERNRLLLARLLARPSNLLILDEPTNDLDMDTLDMLEEVLADYDGTLLLVSHDRDFLDRLVTSVIAMEGDGSAREYVGGYSDYLAQRRTAAPPPRTQGPQRPVPAKDDRPRERARLGYQEQRELDALPARIETLQAAVAAVEERLADPGLYGRDPDGFAAATADLERLRGELAAAEERWLELEMKREEMSGGRR